MVSNSIIEEHDETMINCSTAVVPSTSRITKNHEDLASIQSAWLIELINEHNSLKSKNESLLKEAEVLRKGAREMENRIVRAQKALRVGLASKNPDDHTVAILCAQGAFDEPV